MGKDAVCLIRNWLISNIIEPFNCTLPYMTDIPGISKSYPICDPSVILKDYYNTVEVVRTGTVKDW